MTLKALRIIIDNSKDTRHIASCHNDAILLTGHAGTKTAVMGPSSTVASRAAYGETRILAFAPNAGDHRIG